MSLCNPMEDRRTQAERDADYDELAEDRNAVDFTVVVTLEHGVMDIAARGPGGELLTAMRYRGIVKFVGRALEPLLNDASYTNDQFDAKIVQLTTERVSHHRHFKGVRVVRTPY